MPRHDTNDINGVLLVDKRQDWTSYDAVNCVKHKFHPAKIGHSGTLDPLATGLLVLLLGKATKLQDRFMGESKIYRGSLRLGVESDSEDITGTITATHDTSGIDAAALGAAMKSMLGKQMQVPPMVSALKKDGRPLYELARKGITIEREPREITIFSFEMLDCSLPDAEFIVHCTRGAYVRTICADIGKRLGCGAVMTALRRVQCGGFKISDAHDIESIKNWEMQDLLANLIPVEQFL
ncbi:MAG: tRNA pseudouridine(55) synthase TruB [Victivallales bacterium]|nr:tRNA pseudouridine(55) synthase TruB [Victivallales bacterium]